MVDWLGVNIVKVAQFLNQKGYWIQPFDSCAEEDSNIAVKTLGLKVSFLASELCKLSRQLQLSEFK